MTKQRKRTLFPYTSCNASPLINLRVLLNMPVNAALAHVRIAISARIVVVVVIGSGNRHSFARAYRAVLDPVARRTTPKTLTGLSVVRARGRRSRVRRRNSTNCQLTNVHWIAGELRSGSVRWSSSFGRELLNCPQEVGVYPRQGKLLRQAAANS